MRPNDYINFNHLFSYATMIRIFCKKKPPEFGKKQPPEVFYKKSCSEKFCNFHRKTPKLESLSNKGADQKEKTKKRFQRMCFPVNIVKFLRTPIA